MKLGKREIPSGSSHSNHRRKDNLISGQSRPFQRKEDHCHLNEKSMTVSMKKDYLELDTLQYAMKTISMFSFWFLVCRKLMNFYSQPHTLKVFCKYPLNMRIVESECERLSCERYSPTCYWASVFNLFLRSFILVHNFSLVSPASFP